MDPEELKSLEKLAKTEAKDNDLEFNRQLGKSVRYGQGIQLKHIITGKYVQSSSSEAAALDVMNMMVSLSPDNAKSNAIFLSVSFFFFFS